VSELVRWEDDQWCLTGISHSRRLANGTVLSLCSHFDVDTMKISLMLFKMEGDNAFKRKVIA